MSTADENRLMRAGLQAFVQSLMEEIFTKSYARKNSPPKCAARFINLSYPAALINTQALDEILASDSDEDSVSSIPS